MHDLYSLCRKLFRGQTDWTIGLLHSLTYFNAVNGDVDRIEAHCAWSPVGAVGPVSVGTDQHVLTGSVKREMI